MRRQLNPVYDQRYSLESQFAKRQEAFMPNMDVVEERDLYRVTGIEMGEYTPPSADNTHTMVCFDPPTWRALHGQPCEP